MILIFPIIIKFLIKNFKNIIYKIIQIKIKKINFDYLQ